MYTIHTSTITETKWQDHTLYNVINIHNITNRTKVY